MIKLRLYRLCNQVLLQIKIESFKCKQHTKKHKIKKNTVIKSQNNHYDNKTKLNNCPNKNPPKNVLKD